MLLQSGINIPPLPDGLTVQVFLAGTSTLASVTDKTGAAITQPFAVSGGRYEFDSGAQPVDIKLGGEEVSPDDVWNGGDPLWIYSTGGGSPYDFALGSASGAVVGAGESLDSKDFCSLFQANDAGPTDWNTSFGTYPMGVNFFRSSSVRAQLAMGYGGHLAYRVTSGAGVFSGWRRVYDRENILGIVAQSSGVPSGAIIERGSNSNGEYVKFADGTLICTGSVISVAGANTDNSLAKSPSGVTWTFPISFIDLPTLSFFIDKISTAETGVFPIGVARLTGGTVSVSSATTIYVWYNKPGSVVQSQIALTAIGRWF
ncbi:hypothetical protein [Desulfuromonas acetoxidans]|uniref:hypothetical protein n=1 Tax=Desulfuromonas acetoxidans TaxID=891 RepID=UPI002931E20E|nr:hypothetical protein [Desulfuromonas acetoxidans]